MTVGTKLGSMIVIGAVALSACASAEDAVVESSTTLADVASTTAAPTASTAQPGSPEMGEIQMSETLDPLGSVDGGNVGLSYVYDEYPTELNGIVGLAVSDLATRLEIAESAITVVLVEEVVWSDGSLGCPQPGMSYIQVLTDGLRTVLEANGRIYDYRSGGSSGPVLCEQAVVKDEPSAGMFELTPEGEVIPVTTVPSKETGAPTEGLNPPDQ